jgi:hypothetical protein
MKQYTQSLIFLGLCYISCKPNNESKIKGIYEPASAWGNLNIPVCFAVKENLPPAVGNNIISTASSEHLSAESKKYIKDVILHEFSRTGVPFNFTGWNNCDSSQMQGIYIGKSIKDSGYGGLSNIGKNVEYNSEAIPKSIKSSNQTAVMLNEDSAKSNFTNPKRFKAFMQLITLHEVGHAIGLHHEHNRPEAKDDSNCQARAAASGISLADFTATDPNIQSTKALTTPYDKYSMMNYCYGYVTDGISDPDKVLALSHYSWCDLHTIATLYGSATSDSYSKCMCSVGN